MLLSKDCIPTINERTDDHLPVKNVQASRMAQSVLHTTGEDRPSTSSMHSCIASAEACLRAHGDSLEQR